MPYPRFLAFDLSGTLLWSLTFILLGRFFGDVAKRSQAFFGLLSHFAAAGLHPDGRRLLHLARHQAPPLRSDGPRPPHRALRSQGNDRPGAGRRGEHPYIVDLRHPLDYLPDPRVLPGAVRIGPNEIAACAAIIPRDRDVILYCTCPSEETSAKVALQLHRLGITRVRPLRGGFDGWKQAGYPLLDYIEDSALPTPSLITPAAATLKSA